MSQLKNKPLADYPEVMSARMVAEYLGIGYTKTLALLKSGECPCIRIGNAYKVPKASFARWLGEPGLRKFL
jgi:excisionase family DNA binding protein